MPRPFRPTSRSTITMRKVRKFISAREALFCWFIPESVYDSLVEAVNKHLPLLQRYVKLRSKILELKIWRCMMSTHHCLLLTTSSLTKKPLPNLSRLWRCLVMTTYPAWSAPSPNVGSTSKSTKGKRSGAYSGGSYDTNAFMLLNWQKTSDNLFTLVHETGHSMHSSYTRETQPYVYGDYSIFLSPRLLPQLMKISWPSNCWQK